MKKRELLTGHYCRTLGGETFHRAVYVEFEHNGGGYTKSLRGLIDSTQFAYFITFEEKDYNKRFGLRPCKKCFP